MGCITGVVGNYIYDYLKQKSDSESNLIEPKKDTDKDELPQKQPNSTLLNKQQEVQEDNSKEVLETSSESTQNNSINTVNSNSLKRVIDKEGNTYEYAELLDGTHWLTKNLNIDIPESYCVYERECGKNSPRGRVYSQKAAKMACEMLGNGWRLPSDLEWRSLINAYGGYQDYIDGNSAQENEIKKAYLKLGEYGESGFSLIKSNCLTKKILYGKISSFDPHGCYWSSSSQKSKGLLVKGAVPIFYYYGNDIISRQVAIEESYKACRCINTKL